MMSDVRPGDWLIGIGRTAPLPDQLAGYISDSIREGKLTAGEQLPGEYDLAKKLKVSRTTVRAATQTLLARGVLERRRGIGTFVTSVSPLVIENDIAAFISTTNLLRQAGCEPGVANFQSELVRGSKFITSTLKLPVGTELLHISRTRTANHKPVSHSEEYLPSNILCPDDLPSAESNWSLYGLIESKGYPLSSAICKIAAVSANANLARLLHVRARYPLMFLRQIVFSIDNKPILYCENYHDSNAIEFQVLRRP